MKKKHKVSKEIKDQIIGRIKNDGISVSQASTDHGISPNTIYGWLSIKVTGTVKMTEHLKLKKQRDQLLQIVGKLTMEKSISQKKI